MKTIFVVNPRAGLGKGQKFVNEIEEVIKSNKYDAEIYLTKAIDDAEKFIMEYCHKYGKARFIICGGDGTLSEALNGAIYTEGVEIGVIPCGTGNDFCRNFTDVDFNNIVAQIESEAIKCDAIKYTDLSTNEEKYCVNMFNIGFDCNVADMTSKMKKKPLVSGSLAYLLSIFVMLLKKKGAKVEIALDGKTVSNGQILLTSIANGSYCGGGVKSNPMADVHSGFINVNIVKNISRINFISKLPFYMKGTHVKLKNIEKVICNQNCKKAVVTPKNEKMRLCIDGRITDVGKTQFEIVRDAFNFVVPRNV